MALERDLEATDGRQLEVAQADLARDYVSWGMEALRRRVEPDEEKVAIQRHVGLVESRLEDVASNPSRRMEGPWGKRESARPAVLECSHVAPSPACRHFSLSGRGLASPHS